MNIFLIFFTLSSPEVFRVDFLEDKAQQKLLFPELVEVSDCLELMEDFPIPADPRIKPNPE